MIKLVVFDLDDTLYREFDFVSNGFKAVANYLSEKYQYDAIELYNDMLSTLEKEGRGKIFDRLYEKYSLSEKLSELIFQYRNNKGSLKLYEDAQKSITHLKSKGMLLGIITDGIAIAQNNKIDSLQLNSVMDAIIVTDELGEKYKKPNPKAYMILLERFGVKPNEMMYIGDNPNKDFIGAKALEISTTRIIRKYGDHMKTYLEEKYEADYKITSLNQLWDLIERINKF